MNGYSWISSRAYHSRYNNILLNISMVDDKVAYMAFFKGLRYGKLKKALLVLPLLMKDELIAAVTTHIELEELKLGTEQPVDFKEMVLRKDGNVSPKKLSVWERIKRDRGQLVGKPYKSTFPQRGMVRCNQKTSTYEVSGNKPLRVSVAEIQWTLRVSLGSRNTMGDDGERSDEYNLTHQTRMLLEDEE
ncbi:hypothetical protein LIER_07556 [Lithospermum erythrorhizon]|uniref:Uncharacterized protein n=1 Tax=Lithospermum erythrorhizon TaxID=34254 RepID=A0AAV3P8J3_LITER